MDASNVTPPQDRIANEDFSRFADFFYRRTGIMFGENKKYFVVRRILDRMEATGSGSFRVYFGLLRFQANGEEFQSLVNAMTVNETYFLREDYQFDALVHGILPEIVSRRARGSVLRIWCMPCSTGEEPFSVAIHILENWVSADNYEIEIMASDIDTRVIAHARAGIYGDRSLQRVKQSIRDRYFVRRPNNQYQIIKALRDSIEFSVANIVDPLQMSKFREVDVIFCRNLLIYFDDISRRKAVEALYECLAPGGYVCLGHSESMSRMSSLFSPRRFLDAVVYQKPLVQD